MGSDIGNAVGPAMGGVIASCVGYGYMFFAVAAALLVIGWPLVYIKTRYDKKKYGEAA